MNDADKIEQVLAAQKIMEKAGVAKKADYRLEPALGNGPAKTARSGPVHVRMSSY